MFPDYKATGKYMKKIKIKKIFYSVMGNRCFINISGNFMRENIFNLEFFIDSNYEYSVKEKQSYIQYSKTQNIYSENTLFQKAL